MKLICEKRVMYGMWTVRRKVSPNIAYPWLLKNWDIFIRPLIRRNALIVGFVKKHAHRCMIRYVCIRQWHTRMVERRRRL